MSKHWSLDRDLGIQGFRDGWMEMLEVAFATCKGSGWHVYKFDLRENFYESLPAVLFCNGVRKFIKLCSEPCDSTPANASKG